jgi:hypothetical protein
MPDSHDTPGHGALRHTRRAVLSTAAALGILVPAAPAAFAAETRKARPGRPARAPAGVTDSKDAQATAPASGTREAREIWGTSPSGHGIGVRGSGHRGVVGEGTHSGVSGDGFIGVRGATSIARGDERGVGVWAQASLPGSTALRADGPSEFNGVTTFSRSGVALTRRGSASVTVPGVALTADTAILATLQDRVDGLQLHAVETDPATGSFTIFLSTAAARDVRIGWFALG